MFSTGVENSPNREPGTKFRENAHFSTLDRRRQIEFPVYNQKFDRPAFTWF